jgi:hypothetical protein
MIPSFEGKQVTLVGRVLQSTNNQTVLEASDHQQVRVMGNQPFASQACVEVNGWVQKDGSIAETGRTLLNDNFNFDTYEELLRLMQNPEVKSLFA